MTRKYQAIRAKVREALNLQAGDLIAFDLDDDRVRLRKATAIDVEFANALTGTLGEWSSEADEEAYRDP